MTFCFCLNCSQKIILKGSGNKVKHFKGNLIRCHKCSKVFLIGQKGELKPPITFTIRELVKLGIIPLIEFKRITKHEYELLLT